MSEKVTVVLRSQGSVEIEFPEGKEAPKNRSCFGALRLFAGIPRAITREELEWIEKKEPKLFARLRVAKYVESKRVDRRGASEAEVERLAEREGIGHLPPGRRLEVLRKRGKVKPPEPNPVRLEKPAKSKPAAKPPATKPSER